MQTFVGKSGLTKATILADSISEAGVRMVTWEIEYPRLILAELNTHRALSKNSASSRAIPFNKMVAQLNGRPVRFGKANPGMQDTGEDFEAPVLPEEWRANAKWEGVEPVGVIPKGAWELAKHAAIEWSEAFFKAGYHKQVYNRLTEPFQVMKTVISGTEDANFFWLRDDVMADPTLGELAGVMRQAKEASTPTLLKAGWWHLPYVDFTQEVIGYTDENEDHCILEQPVFYIGNLLDETYQKLTIEEAIKVSCARCAAVSYRNEDYGLEKSKELYERLVGSDKKHASALEHCATPMSGFVKGITMKTTVNSKIFPPSWQKGISHMDSKGQLWSGNLRGWIQHRKTVDGENYEG